MKKKKPDRRHGFSLIELLVVIGIVAILASLLLPALGQAQNSAKEINCLNIKKQLITITQYYAMDNNYWIVGAQEPYGSLPVFPFLINLRYITQAQCGVFWRCTASGVIPASVSSNTNGPTNGANWNFYRQNGANRCWNLNNLQFLEDRAMWSCTRGTGVYGGADGGYAWGQSSINEIGFRHMMGKGSAMSFLDGHAALMSYSVVLGQTVNNKRFWYPWEN